MPFKELSDISKEYFFREIVFTPELNKFYKREYLTNLEFEQNQDSFKELTLDEQKEILVEMLNKNNLYINLSDIDDIEYGITEDAKLINKDFYRDYNGF